MFSTFGTTLSTPDTPGEAETALRTLATDRAGSASETVMGKGKRARQIAS
jgi:hypothetical protein